MHFVNFKSNPQLTPFAPNYSYFLVEETIKNFVKFSSLKNYLIKKEKTILKKPIIKIKATKISIDGYTNLGKNSTTARYNQYNIFTWKNKEITNLKKAIIYCHEEFLKKLKVKIDKPVYISGWFNVMKKGQSIDKHLHSVTPNCYLSGNVCVSCNKTSTFYINPINQINDPAVFESKNEIGKIVIFQSNIPHYTNKHNSAKDRITIAFDLWLGKPEHINQAVRLIP